jgi:hypothetical protein
MTIYWIPIEVNWVDQSKRSAHCNDHIRWVNTASPIDYAMHIPLVSLGLFLGWFGHGRISGNGSMNLLGQRGRRCHRGILDRGRGQGGDLRERNWWYRWRSWRRRRTCSAGWAEAAVAVAPELPIGRSAATPSQRHRLAEEKPMNFFSRLTYRNNNELGLLGQACLYPFCSVVPKFTPV